MVLFLTLFIVTVVLGIAAVFFLFKINKYEWKPLAITGTLFVICLAIVIPLGNNPIVDETAPEKDESYSENVIKQPIQEVEDVTSEPSTIDSQIVTKDESNQIKKGMSYDEVVTIIGEEGKLEKETRTDYGTHTAYKWGNTDGSYAFIQFLDKNTGTPVVTDFRFVDLQ